MQVFNSLTKTLVPFSGPNLEKKALTWYICGPTVYDSAHLGHARNYVSFDIIHRILRDYFNYDVNLVMNITDIDDKIIHRAREQGVSITDLARKYEKEFLEDLNSLSVIPARTLTRVSEYIPEIIAYIQKIIDNKYAYPLDGSVYFDSEAFEKKHSFSALRHDCEDLAEGEDPIPGRKSPKDFALWKVSKSDDIGWESPWGSAKSVPGWHIECTAMSHAILGSSIDMHSGGEDLAFPHHNNEIAQADAHSDTGKPWVKYFLHSGHLHIDGRKMSKSLKNFITIREALQTYTARQIRMLCLLHHYRDTMVFSADTMKHAVERDEFFAEFLGRTEALLRIGTYGKCWQDRDNAMSQVLSECKHQVDKSLNTDFDTPSVMKELAELIHQTNIYLRQETWQLGLLTSILDYVQKMLGIFGLSYTTKLQDDTAEKVINALSTFRDNVRSAAKGKAVDRGAILKLTDEMRDVTFPSLGLKLVDSQAGGVWSHV